MAKTIDTELGLELSGGNKALADDLFRMLMSELPAQLADIERSCGDNDQSSLLEAAHKLNGATRYCGVPALQDVAMHFEKVVRQGDETVIASHLDMLRNEVRSLLDASRTFQGH
jgi:two-component system sensor histidine kinase BarA